MPTGTGLRKDALAKDYSLDKLLKDGEANELARTRAATVEKKNIQRVSRDDEELTDAEAQTMIAKLKRSGKYSVRQEKTRERQEKETACDRCTNARRLHTQETCYFRDKTCRVCQKVGHMGGAKRCEKQEKSIHKVEITSKDYEDSNNWHHASGEVLRGETTGPHKISIKKVGKKRNTVNVKVGGVDTEMFADSGADVPVVPAHWYESGMGEAPSNR